jgi:hypothetical protein
MTEQWKEKGEKRILRIVQLLKEAESGDYSVVSTRLREARDLFHTQIADQLTPVLNKHCGQSPHENLRQKQDLGRWVNAELRSLGLTLRYPGTENEPALLQADAGRHPETGQWRLVMSMREDHPRKTSIEMPKLELMADPPRREPLAEYWAKRLTVGKGRRERD